MNIRRILLIEDEYLVGLNINSILADAGYDITGPIMNIKSALPLIEPGSFDAAVLDINLGGRFSTPIANKLSSCGIPYILLTGYTKNDLPPDVLKAPLVEKPFDEDILLEELANCIGLDKNLS